MATLHVGGRFPNFYYIVFKSLWLQASTRIWIRCVFKSFHSGDHFQKFAVTVCRFRRVDEGRIRNKMFVDTNESGYVWILISLHQIILTCISIPFGSSFPLANKTYKNTLVIFAKFARQITSMRVLSGINSVNR